MLIPPSSQPIDTREQKRTKTAKPNKNMKMKMSKNKQKLFLGRKCFSERFQCLEPSRLFISTSFLLSHSFSRERKKLVSIKNVLLYRRMIIRHSDAGSSFSSPSSDEESISYFPDSIRLIKTDLLTPISSVNSRTLI